MYCQPGDVWNLLGPDGGYPPSGAGDTDTNDIVEAIEQAQAEVDARLSTRYTVPFAEGAVPRVIVNITRDFAIYLVDLAHRGQVDYDSDRDPILLRRQAADALLTRIVDGNADLGQQTQQSTSRGAGRARNPYDGRMFPGPVVDPLGGVGGPWYDGGRSPWGVGRTAW